MNIKKLDYTELYSLRAEYISMRDYWSEGYHLHYETLCRDLEIEYISKDYIQKLISDCQDMICKIEEEINFREDD